MKLTVIGFRGAYPGYNQAASSYLVEENGEALLLDCGSGSLSKLPAFRERHRLNRIFISHYHADHDSDLGCYQHAALVETSLNLRTVPLEVYGPRDPEHPVPLDYRDVSRGTFCSPGETLETGPFRLSFSANVHPCISLAVRVEAGGRSLVYTGDTQWYEGLEDFCRNADLLVCESSLYNRFYGQVEGHLTAGEAGRLAARSGCGTLILTHLPHYGEHSLLLEEALEAVREQETERPPEVLLAREGLVWEAE